MQRLRLEQEAKIRQREEDIKKKSIEQREKLLKKQRERQQSKYCTISVKRNS